LRLHPGKASCTVLDFVGLHRREFRFDRRLRALLESDRIDGAVGRTIRIGQILHPSPASPAANRGWADAVDARLAELGVLPAPRP
jgi:hypothetical protein